MVLLMCYYPSKMENDNLLCSLPCSRRTAAADPVWLAGTRNPTSGCHFVLDAALYHHISRQPGEDPLGNRLRDRSGYRNLARPGRVKFPWDASLVDGNPTSGGRGSVYITALCCGQHTFPWLHHPQGNAGVRESLQSVQGPQSMAGASGISAVSVPG